LLKLKDKNNKLEGYLLDAKNYLNGEHNEEAQGHEGRDQSSM
jgi:hypothetical protein